MVLTFKGRTAHRATIQAMLNVLGAAGAAVANTSAPPLEINIAAAPQ
jgi:hypothetical protein